MGITLDKELEAAQRAAFTAKAMTYVNAKGEDRSGNITWFDFGYTNLVNDVIELFNQQPDLEHVWVGVNKFSRRQKYLRWVTAHLSFPFEAAEPNKFTHIDEVISDEYRDRQRQRWLTEVW
jgi:hypothetical protein